MSETESGSPEATQIMVTVFLSLKDWAHTNVDVVEDALLEACDSAGAKIEAEYSGVQVVAVQATVV